MHTPTSHTLAVPDATLYYEIRGAGPLLLLISGGNGETSPFDALAERLADGYTVVAYDRRGFSRSPEDGAVDHRVELDAADAAALLTHLGDQPAAVFGSSSGAIVALALFSTRPELVHTLIAHESPLATVLPDAAEWLTFFDGIYQINQTEGNFAAMAAFGEGVGLRRPQGGSRRDQPPEMRARIQRNLQFLLEYEMRQYARYTPDMDALHAAGDKLVLAVGHDSKDAFPALPNTVIAAQLGSDLVEFAGDHVGYVAAPDEFAAQLDKLLIERTIG